MRMVSATPRLGIQIAIPPTYNEATSNTPSWPFVNDAFVEKGVYYMMGELVCRRFNGQGKLIDISV